MTEINYPKIFRKKPVEIEAMQLTGSAGERHAVYQWVEENTLGSFEPMAVIEGRTPPPSSGVSIDPRDGRLMIATLEGVHWADLDDWIIRGVAGEFYPCKPDIFAATYDPVPEPERWVPKVGDVIHAYSLSDGDCDSFFLGETVTEVTDRHVRTTWTALSGREGKDSYLLDHYRFEPVQ